MKILAFLIPLLLGAIPHAYAQSSPGLIYGQVPTATQWNSYFTSKQDNLGFIPLNKAGDSMSGLLSTIPATTFTAGFHIGPGVAPSLPNNGDIWIASNALWAQLGGISVQLLATGSPTQSVSQAYLNTSSGPSLSSCGTSPAVTAGSNNQGGQFTLGSATPTACTVTLANPFPTNAFCVIAPASNYAGTYYISAQSASAFTVTLGTPTSSVIFNYNCQGN